MSPTTWRIDIPIGSKSSRQEWPNGTKQQAEIRSAWSRNHDFDAGLNEFRHPGCGLP